MGRVLGAPATGANIPVQMLQVARRRGWQRRQRATFALAFIFTMGGISTGCGSDAAPVPPLPADPARNNAHPVGPEWRLKQLWASPTSYNRASFELRQEAISSCMNAAGFEYSPAQYETTDNLIRALNPLNREAAQLYGYHEPPSPEFDDPTAENSDDEYILALYGTDEDEGGCATASAEYAYGWDGALQLSNDLDIAANGVGEILGSYVTTPDGQDHVEAWASCMHEHGYQYDNQIDPNTEYSGQDRISDKEIATRLTDIECDESVGLTAARSDYETQQIDQWVDEHNELIDGIRKLTTAGERELADRMTDLVKNGPTVLDN